MAPKLQTRHAADPYAGMVRFDTSSGKQKRSSYMTFRVMTEHSHGWVIPARPGLFIVKGVVDRMRASGQSQFTDAIKGALGEFARSV